jgi:hypothetical protein
LKHRKLLLSWSFIAFLYQQKSEKEDIALILLGFLLAEPTIKTILCNKDEPITI